MKLSLRDIQLLEVGILDYFVTLCEEHQLTYYLAGGTLLGAIRHQGFIPWDDDIDILMPRPDYDRFQEIAKTLHHNRYSVSSFELGNLNFPFCKIYDTFTKLREDDFLEDGDSHIWIDIFPLDGAPTSDRKLNSMYRKLLFARKLLFIQKSKIDSSQNIFKRCIKSVVKRALNKTIGMVGMINYISNLAKTYDYEMSSHVAGLVWGYGPGERCLKAAYTPQVEVVFESRKFTAPACWDTYLTGLYGDYMVIPEECNRIQHDVEAYLVKGEL